MVREEDREGVTGVSLLSSAFRLVSMTSRALPAMLYALYNMTVKTSEYEYDINMNQYMYVQKTNMYHMDSYGTQ